MDSFLERVRHKTEFERREIGQMLRIMGYGFGQLGTRIRVLHRLIFTDAWSPDKGRILRERQQECTRSCF